MLLMGYATSIFRDSESYLRLVIGVDEDDSRISLKQYNSKFVTYKIPPGINSYKDSSEAVCTMGDHDWTLRIEYDDISMKTKLILKRFAKI